MIWGGALALLVVAASILILYSSKPPPTASRLAEPTAEQSVIVKAERAEALANKAKKERAFYLTVGVLATIKDALRDPKSLEWTLIMTDIDAGVVCATYRARNGFGGMNAERAVYAKERILNTPQAWLKHCNSDNLVSMWSARLAIK